MQAPGRAYRQGYAATVYVWLYGTSSRERVWGGVNFKKYVYACACMRACVRACVHVYMCVHVSMSVYEYAEIWVGAGVGM